MGLSESDLLAPLRFARHGGRLPIRPEGRGLRGRARAPCTRRRTPESRGGGPRVLVTAVRTTPNSPRDRGDLPRSHAGPRDSVRRARPLGLHPTGPARVLPPPSRGRLGRAAVHSAQGRPGLDGPLTRSGPERSTRYGVTPAGVRRRTVATLGRGPIGTGPGNRTFPTRSRTRASRGGWKTSTSPPTGSRCLPARPRR